MNIDFKKILQEYSLENNVVIFDNSTKTAQEAADQIGVQIGQIGKSIIFKLNNEPILVITSGKNKVSIEKLEKLIGERIEKADADFVYEKTGFSIGGVPPFGHKEKIKHIFLDKDLLNYQEIWCAAGTPFSVFKISSQRLIEIAQAKLADIKA
ncbi:MAG: YbaK/EbsC family protein [Candidatus Paceibacterota bacterium]|jgi:prolyl-tRNA editing enzyme YbaK/EbsC (Cys-tRNA(Pro) deacylase)